MSQIFAGFPAKAEYTSVPNLFFTQVMPQIQDMAELKTTLHIFRLLYHKRGYPRFVSFAELLSDTALISGIKDEAKSPAQALHYALDLAIERGTILRLILEKDNQSEEVYFLNTPADRIAMDQIQQGKLPLKGVKWTKEPERDITQPPDIFSLYEQNIGMLTPLIAEELREAEKLYPPEWIRSAFKEAVTLNKRNWKYILRILERWATEGRDNGKPWRDFKKETDPNKYIKGKYGRLVRR